MIRASEIGLGVDVIDMYQNSVYSVPSSVIMAASIDRNVGRKGSQIEGGDYGGTQVYDFFGPSSFFPMSVPDNHSVSDVTQPRRCQRTSQLYAQQSLQFGQDLGIGDSLAGLVVL